MNYAKTIALILALFLVSGCAKTAIYPECKETKFNIPIILVYDDVEDNRKYIEDIIINKVVKNSQFPDKEHALSDTKVYIEASIKYAEKSKKIDSILVKYISKENERVHVQIETSFKIEKYKCKDMRCRIYSFSEYAENINKLNVKVEEKMFPVNMETLKELNGDEAYILVSEFEKNNIKLEQDDFDDALKQSISKAQTGFSLNSYLEIQKDIYNFHNKYTPYRLMETPR